MDEDVLYKGGKLVHEDELPLIISEMSKQSGISKEEVSKMVTEVLLKSKEINNDFKVFLTDYIMKSPSGVDLFNINYCIVHNMIPNFVMSILQCIESQISASKEMKVIPIRLTKSSYKIMRESVLKEIDEHYEKHGDKSE